MGERRRTYEVKRTEIETKRSNEWIEILWVLGVRFFFSFPSSPSFSYGNPSSSSELLGSSINQRLYEIPAGAKGQRRKLAAVFSSPFMLAVGLIAKCAISLISTLKQTPRQAGEELCARSYILWHRILFWEEEEGERWEEEGGGPAPVFCHPSPSTLFFFPSTYPIIFRCGRANSGACSSHTALLTHFSSAGGAVMIGGLSLCSTPRWCYSLIGGPVNSVDLFTPTVSVILLPYC